MLYAEGTVTGVGFLTHADRELGVNPEVFGNIIAVPNGCGWWTERNGLTLISKDDAQGRFDAYIDAKIASYDPDPDPWRYHPERTVPVRRTLP